MGPSTGVPEAAKRLILDTTADVNAHIKTYDVSYSEAPNHKKRIAKSVNWMQIRDQGLET